MNSPTMNRLSLRPLEERDAGNIFLLNSDPEVLKYVHDEPFRDIDAARDWIRDIAQQLPDGIGRWAMETADGTWIGRCSLRRQPDGTVLMGYRLLREHWGKGYASEAVRQMLRIAFSSHKLSHVHSKVARENIASQLVVAKNGGVFWNEDACGHFSDALVYRFVNPAKRS